MATKLATAMVCLGFLAAVAVFTCPKMHGSVLSGWSHLRAPVPSPQPRPDKWWQDAHETLKKEVEEADAEDEGFELLFYGDSITEGWRGTDRGMDCSRCEDAPAIFDQYFGSKFRTDILAIGGDQTAHLLWRLQNGELPRVNHPKLVTVLIGTNDLGAATEEGEPGVLAAGDGAIARVVDIVRHLRDNLPDTHVVLLALLPRGSPNPLYRYHVPNIFTQAIAQFNWRLKSLTMVDGYLHFLDCSDAFVYTQHGAIDPTLMPDALHPSAQGYELLAECMDPLILTLMRHAPLEAHDVASAR